MARKAGPDTARRGRPMAPREQGGRQNMPERAPKSAKSGHTGGRHSGNSGADKADIPHGSVLLYGRNSVQAALKNPKRVILDLIADRKGGDWITGLERHARFDGETGITHAAQSALFNRLADDGVPHQGVAMLARTLPDLAIEDVLADASDSEPASDTAASNLVLVLDQVTDPQNVGAALRVAAALGARALITQDRNSPGESGALARASAGGLEVMPWVKSVNLSQALTTLADHGYWSLGMAGEAQQSLRDIKSPGKYALVIGSEGRGMRPLVRKSCDQLIKIPMPGDVESLNASTAAAIGLYHLAGL